MEFCAESKSSFVILLYGQPIIVHRPEKPFFYLGKCRSNYKMNLGHFIIEHQIETKSNLQIESINQIDKSTNL